MKEIQFLFVVGMSTYHAEQKTGFIRLHIIILIQLPAMVKTTGTAFCIPNAGTKRNSSFTEVG